MGRTPVKSDVDAASTASASPAPSRGAYNRSATPSLSGVEAYRRSQTPSRQRLESQEPSDGHVSHRRHSSLGSGDADAGMWKKPQLRFAKGALTARGAPDARRRPTGFPLQPTCEGRAQTPQPMRERHAQPAGPSSRPERVQPFPGGQTLDQPQGARPDRHAQAPDAGTRPPAREPPRLALPPPPPPAALPAAPRPQGQGQGGASVHAAAQGGARHVPPRLKRTQGGELRPARQSQGAGNALPSSAAPSGARNVRQRTGEARVVGAQPSAPDSGLGGGEAHVRQGQARSLATRSPGLGLSRSGSDPGGSCLGGRRGVFVGVERGRQRVAAGSRVGGAPPTVQRGNSAPPAARMPPPPPPPGPPSAPRAGARAPGPSWPAVPPAARAGQLGARPSQANRR